MSKLGVLTNPGLRRVAIETKLRRLGVLTNPGVSSVAVETKFAKLAVEIRLSKFGVET